MILNLENLDLNIEIVLTLFYGSAFVDRELAKSRTIVFRRDSPLKPFPDKLLAENFSRFFLNGFLWLISASKRFPFAKVSLSKSILGLCMENCIHNLWLAFNQFLPVAISEFHDENFIRPSDDLV